MPNFDGSTDRLPIITAIAALLILSGCTGSGGDRTAVVVYTPHGKELLNAYESDFEAANPEIDIQWLDMGARAIYDRVSTEKQRPQASIWWGGPHVTFDQAAGEGLLEAFQPTWSSEVGANARHDDHFWYGTYLTPEVITYNHDAVTGDAIATDWDDLLDPAYRDRVLIRAPLASGTMRTIFGAMILRQPTVEEGYQWLAKLDMNTKSYAADPTQLYLKLARGEGDITLWNMPDTDIQSEDNGYPFSFTIPASGTPVLVEGIALVKGGPNLEAAKLFYEFVTSREQMMRQANEFHRIPARQDIPREQLPEWIRRVDIEAMELDWKRIADEGPEWMQFWDENIKGKGEDYLRQRGVALE